MENKIVAISADRIDRQFHPKNGELDGNVEAGGKRAINNHRWRLAGGHLPAKKCDDWLDWLDTKQNGSKNGE
jgi:hypothetical protein